jgi:hypothetical protein
VPHCLSTNIQEHPEHSECFLSSPLAVTVAVCRNTQIRWYMACREKASKNIFSLPVTVAVVSSFGWWGVELPEQPATAASSVQVNFLLHR